MPLLRIAVALHCFGRKFLQSLQAAARSGATGVQIDARTQLQPAEMTRTGRRQLLHRLDEFGLVVASLSFPTRGALQEQNRLEARLDAAKVAMQLAYDLKARVVTFRLGPIPEETESDDYAMLSGVLNELARHGNHIGVTPAVRPARDSAEALAGLLAGVTEGPIGVDFDPALFVLSGHDPAAALGVLHESLAHVLVRDAVRDVDGTGLEVPVGRGEVVWDELLALFDDAGYQSWFTADRTQGDDLPGDVSRAVRYLQQVAGG